MNSVPRAGNVERLPGTRPVGEDDVMPTSQELETLSSRELHDRAVHLAERRLDVRFLWRLVKAIPVARAAAGDLEEAEADVAVSDLVPLLSDLDHTDEGPLAEALRPLYIEYLVEHERP
jgi:hypothetical protein